MKMTNLMVDLETLGNKSNSALLSIGLVEFNINCGETGREFYRTIDLQTCLDLGLKINASTFYWWLQQSQESRDAICIDQQALPQVLNELEQWMKLCKPDIQIWGNGARFDIGLLEDAYVACGYHEMPWGFRGERDVRTLVSLAPEFKANMPFDGVLHNPIDDCKHQIKYCVATHNKILHNII